MRALSFVSAHLDHCCRAPRLCYANSVTTWLCHVLTQPPCQDPNLVAPCNIRLRHGNFSYDQALSKSIPTENSLSQQNSPIARATLSWAPGLVCRARLTWFVTSAWPSLSRHNTVPIVARASLSTPSLVVCGRAFSRGKLYRDIKILCHDRNSPYPGQLYHDIELLYRDIISPYLGQLCRDIKIINRDRKSS